MIVDHISNAGLYGNVSSRLAAGLKFLAGFDAAAAKPGRVEIRGDEVFALPQRYAPKPASQGRWEAHRRYIDIQYVASGAERIGVAPVGSLAMDGQYDAAKDLLFLKGSADSDSFVKVSAGMFVVLWPHEAHMPTIALAGPNDGGEVIKVVVKVLVG